MDRAHKQKEVVCRDAGGRHPEDSLAWHHLRPVEYQRLCQRVKGVVNEGAIADYRYFLLAFRADYECPGCLLSEHLHPFYEGIIVLAGSKTVTSHGQHYELTRGESLLHPPYTLHESRCGDSPCSYLALQFELHPPPTLTMQQQALHCAGLLETVMLLAAEARTGLPGWPCRADHLVAVIISKMLTQVGWPVEQCPSPDPAENMASAVEKYLSEHLASQVSLADIAQALQISVRTLVSRFRQQTGETVIGRLHHLRMARAIELMDDKNISLREIGLLVGIPDPAYLCNRFQKYFGISPKRYHRMILDRNRKNAHAMTDSSPEN